jgi:hypothetical protein
MQTAHVLVRLAVRDEDELAIIQILRDIDHGVVEPATAMPLSAEKVRAVTEAVCVKYV